MFSTVTFVTPRIKSAPHGHAHDADPARWAPNREPHPPSPPRRYGAVLPASQPSTHSCCLPPSASHHHHSVNTSTSVQPCFASQFRTYTLRWYASGDASSIITR